MRGHARGGDELAYVYFFLQKLGGVLWWPWQFRGLQISTVQYCLCRRVPRGAALPVQVAIAAAGHFGCRGRERHSVAENDAT